MGLKVRDDAIHLPGRPDWELKLEVWQFRDARPGRLVWCAADLEDPEKLVDFRVPWEQRLLGEELKKDASDRPYVDADRVMGFAK